MLGFSSSNNNIISNDSNDCYKSDTLPVGVDNSCRRQCDNDNISTEKIADIDNVNNCYYLNANSRCAPPTSLPLPLSVCASAPPPVAPTSAPAPMSHHQEMLTQWSPGSLPFPGEIGPDGKFMVGYLNPNGMRKDMLKYWCKSFRLDTSGKVSELKAQLRAFSEDRTAWDSRLPGAVRAHKGISSDKPSKKRSIKRQELLAAGSKGNIKTDIIKHQLPTERSKDTRTEAQIAYVLPWAANVMKKFPYRAPMDNVAPASPFVIDKTPTPDNHPSPLATPSEETANEAQVKLQLEDMRRQQEHAQQQLDHILAQLSLFVPSTSGTAITMAPITPVTSSDVPPATTHLEAISTSPHINEHLWAVPRNKAEKVTKTQKKVKELTLGNGTTLMFTPEDVPFLKAITFSCQLSRLNAIWDDTSEYWNKDSPLRIKGEPIALVYWPTVFAYTNSKAWSKIKQDYSDWKGFVKRFRRGTGPEFWAEFSDKDGKHLAYTTIMEMLREERKMEYAATVRLARAAHPQDFDQVFSYIKNGKRVVMSLPHKIHEHYYKIHPKSN